MDCRNAPMKFPEVRRAPGARDTAQALPFIVRREIRSFFRQAQGALRLRTGGRFCAGSSWGGTCQVPPESERRRRLRHADSSNSRRRRLIRRRSLMLSAAARGTCSRASSRSMRESHLLPPSPLRVAFPSVKRGRSGRKNRRRWTGSPSTSQNTELRREPGFCAIT